MSFWTCQGCNRYNGAEMLICHACNAHKPRDESSSVALEMPSAPLASLTASSSNAAYAETSPLPGYEPAAVTKEESVPPPSYSATVLPPGWEARADQWGRTYYVDHATQSTHWELPPTASPAYPPVYVAPASTVDHPLAPSFPSYPATDSPSTPASTHTIAAPAIPTEYYSPPVVPHADRPYDARYDFDILSPSRMQSYPLKQWTEADASRWVGPLAAIWDTVCKNTCMCILMIPLWGFLGLIMAGVFAFEEVEIAMVIPGAQFFFFFYVIYLTLVACPACNCCCDPQSNSGIVEDVPYAALQATVQCDYGTVEEHLRTLAAAEPVLTLHVQCSHTRSSGSGKRRKSKTVVTFKESRVIPIVSWRDISADPAEVCAVMARYAAGYNAIRYEMKYDLCPEQQPLLESMSQAYYEANRHRDINTKVWYTYDSPAYDKARVDSVAKKCSLRYILSHFVMNCFIFYLFNICTLFPIYLILWKLVQKPYYLPNHKLLYLGYTDVTAPLVDAIQARHPL